MSEAKWNEQQVISCKCFGAGNGMKWFNPDCPMHGFGRKLPDDQNLPKMSPEMEEKFKEVFKDLKKK